MHTCMLKNILHKPIQKSALIGLIGQSEYLDMSCNYISFKHTALLFWLKGVFC